MGLERLVGFDSELKPEDDGWSFVRWIFVPGSFVATALSWHKGTVEELTHAALGTPSLPNEDARAELIINYGRLLASDMYGALIGETLRLAGYATLAYTALKGISDIVS